MRAGRWRLGPAQHAAACRPQVSAKLLPGTSKKRRLHLQKRAAAQLCTCAPAWRRSGRLGLVTGRDLAQHCGQQYPRFARVFLWVMIEIAIVGADVQETVGCAQALHLLSQGNIPLWAGAPSQGGD